MGLTIMLDHMACTSIQWRGCSVLFK